MKDKPDFVPFRFLTLVNQLFDSHVIAPRYDEESEKHLDEISSPSVSEFTSRLAEEMLENEGPRRLMSFVFRCEGTGEWAEVATVNKVVTNTKKKKKKSDPTIKETHTRQARYSKLEYELVSLRRSSGVKPLNASQQKRLEELETLLPEHFAKKSDEELRAICLKWCQDLRSTLRVVDG